MAESLDIQIARLQEQFKAVVTSLTEDRESHREFNTQLLRIAVSLESLDKRVGIVETQFAQNAPTIEEFVTIKHQVRGAGILGKWAWIIGAATIGYAFAAREAIRSFLAY